MLFRGLFELVGDAGGELAQDGQLAGLDELLLLVARLVLRAARISAVVSCKSPMM